MKRLSALLGVVALLIALAVPASQAIAASPGQLVDLKVLLLTQTGNEPSLDAWKSALQREGTPFDVIDVDAVDIGSSTLTSSPTHAKYQAIVIATSVVVAALSPAAQTALQNFETTFGIRRIVAYIFPGPDFGLNLAGCTPPGPTGNLAGTTGNLTAAGASVFPYLAGPVPIDPFSFGYCATPAPGANFQTLVTGPGGSSIVGIHTLADGRQEMVATFDTNQYMLQGLLLSHGMLRWVTGGAYLGYTRNYWTVDIDDVFGADDAWNTGLNTTPEEGQQGHAFIRMTAANVDHVVAWQNQTGLTLDMVFNGGGSGEWGEDTTPPTGLTARILANKGQFRWINHTWSHETLWAPVNRETIEEQIQLNIDWANTHMLPIDPGELVTGDHSGVQGAFPANPAMAPALAATGVDRIASDASWTPNQTQIGAALTVPRYPSNVYYNVSTMAQQLDEYNYIYLPPAQGGSCLNTPTTTCLTSPATWGDFLNSETNIMLPHLLRNDPRRHFAHQSNLTGPDYLILQLMDSVLARYTSYVNRSVAPIVQPTLREAGDLMARMNRWSSAMSGGQIATAYMRNSCLYLSSATSVSAPVTGDTTVGSAYGGDRSGWTQLSPGRQQVLAIGSSTCNTPPVVDSGVIDQSAPKTNDTLTVTVSAHDDDGDPLTYTYQWAKNGVDLPGKISATLNLSVPGNGDEGDAISVRVTASDGSVQSTPVTSAAVTVANSDPTLPAAPTGLTATLQPGQVSLAWTNNALGATGFVVERAVNGGAFTTIGTPAVTTFPDTMVTPGNSYAYRVRAVNLVGTSGPSNGATVAVPALPAAPTNLNGTLQAGPQIRLVWRDNASNETGFNVERMLGSGAFEVIATVPARDGVGNVVYVDLTVTSGDYSYRVTTVNGAGRSAYSNTATVPAPAVPAAPSGLAGVLVGIRAVALSWTDNAVGETRFQLQRARNAAFTTVLNTRTLGANVTSFTQTGLARRTTFYFRIRAYNSISGPSGWSNVVSVTTQ